MLKKITFILVVFISGIVVLSTPNVLSAAPSYSLTDTGEVSEAQKVAVCAEMDKRGIMQMNIALQKEHEGKIIVEHNGVKHYRVVTPGGLLIADLEVDNL